MKNKGFTLIELLAVIVILGVILIIAIPSVSTYISSSRRSTYISQAEGYIDGVINMIASKEISTRRKDTTYYIPIECIEIDKGGYESPYGEWKEAYVVVTYTDQKYNYYWTSTDEEGMGVLLTYRDKLNEDSIKSDIDSISTNIGVADRDKIMVFKKVSAIGEPIKCEIEKDVNGDQLYHAADEETKVEEGGALDSASPNSDTYKGYTMLQKTAVLDSISSTYVSSSTGINFASSPSDTNGKGLYIRKGTENNQYPIYYYRGAVTNNNVIFANFCWKIVRTTETGGIKLLYNGIPSNGTCNNRGSASQIGTSKFHENNTDNIYVGYMYGTIDSNSYEATHKNLNDSIIKKTIDEWYKINIDDKGFTSKLEDTVWCNDRSFTEGDGFNNSATYYSARDRNYNSRPSLTCQNKNDRFTVSSSNGNGALKYPVALLTADEATLAGSGWDGYSYSNYLSTGQWWWTMSPDRFDGSNSYIFYVESSLRNAGAYNSAGVRPAVSLKPGTKFMIGGDGTANNPYIVK